MNNTTRTIPLDLSSYKMNNTTSTTLSYSMTENTPYYYEFTEFVYMSFAFEHPIYLFIWEIMVAISAVLGTLFILTLMRKKLRSVTSYIFCAIAFSDIMTGLVTLPTYIMVYQRLSKAEDYSDDEYYMDVNNSYAYYEVTTMTDYPYYADVPSNATTTPGYPALPPMDAYLLSELLCNAFMISKFVLSKFFHTVSIWLTVFLGIQRCLTVWKPFSARSWFSKKRIAIVFVFIFLLALALHGFHIFNDKTIQGYCTWTNDDDCSDGSCIQIMVSLVLRHLLPCTLLTVTTVLMVRKLMNSSFQANRRGSVKKFQHGSEVTDDENRQVTIIVTAIVIVFLITEVPFGCFLFYIAVIENHDTYNFEMNRAIHVVYELTMVLSFNANFVIYTSCNRRFKSEVKNILTCCCGKPSSERKTSQTPSTSQSQPGTEITKVV